MHNHPYKLNFNSIGGIRHRRELCQVFIRSIF
ncbi:putative translational regulatory protein ArgL [Citrobacter amalonaticus]